MTALGIFVWVVTKLYKNKNKNNKNKNKNTNKNKNKKKVRINKLLINIYIVNCKTILNYFSKLVF